MAARRMALAILFAGIFDSEGFRFESAYMNKCEELHNSKRNSNICLRKVWEWSEKAINCDPTEISNETSYRAMTEPLTKQGYITWGRLGFAENYCNATLCFKKPTFEGEAFCLEASAVASLEFSGGMRFTKNGKEYLTSDECSFELRALWDRYWKNMTTGEGCLKPVKKIPGLDVKTAIRAQHQ